jgi:hypothetical protein
MESVMVPLQSVASNCEGSSTGGVAGSEKKANVRQSGVWFIESGTGARAAGGC